jgi:penicillin amidase
VSAAIGQRRRLRRLPPEYSILGFEPEPWGVLDTLAVSRAATTDVSLPSRVLLAEAARHLPADLAARLGGRRPSRGGAGGDEPCRTDEMGAWGSNAAAIAGSKTRDGSPVVLADPHVGLLAPTLWYAATIEIESTGEALAGLTVPGLPFVVLGRNRRVGWGATNMLAESARLYRERLAGPACYQGDRRQPLEIRTETLAVRGERPRRLRVRRTPRGPLVGDAPLLRRLLKIPEGEAMSLLNPAERDGGDELTAFYRMNRAQDLGEFQAALAGWGQCALNFLAADADGRTGQFSAGSVPQGPQSPDGGPWIHDASTDRNEPEKCRAGLVFAPCLDPPSGVLANANDLPVPAGLSARIGRVTAPPYRGRRLRDLLSRRGRLDVEDLLAIQDDCVDACLRSLAVRASGLLRSCTATSRLSRGERDVLELLGRFDGRMVAESAPAAAAGVYAEFLRRRLFAALAGPGVGERFARCYQAAPLCESLLERALRRPREPRSTVVREAACRALADAAGYLRRCQGRRSDRWRWGRAVRVRFAGPLARLPVFGRRFAVGPYPAAGSAHSVRQLRFRFDPARRVQRAFLGVTARLVMPMGTGRLLVATATGQSENPASEHFADLAGELAARRMVRLDLPPGPSTPRGG